MGYRELAIAIVRRAMQDWKLNKEKGKSVSHLTRWFRSEWCDTLLTGLPVTGEQIITALKRGTL